jgi:hypothetical protein
VIPIGRILAAVFAACTIAACSPTRAIESIAVLQDLSGTSAKAAPEQRTQRLAHGFEVDGRTYAADLYVPRDGAKAALVLVPGVTPEGKDDQRLIAFAETMSRAKFLVLVPDIATLRDLRVGPATSPPSPTPSNICRAGQRCPRSALLRSHIPQAPL